MTEDVHRPVPSGTFDAPVRQVGSREVYRNPWMIVREDDVRRADGSAGVYGVVEKPDFALVVPIHHGGFYLVEQYRYPVGRRCWEFPQGSSPTTDPLEVARTELREETGLLAGLLSYLGRIHVAHGYSSQGCHVYLAEELDPGQPEREPAEADMVSRWVSADELDRMIRDGRFADAASLAALAMLDRSL